MAGNDAQLRATLIDVLAIIRRSEGRPLEFPRDFGPTQNQGYCKRYTEALMEALNAEFMEKRGIKYKEIYRAYIGPAYPVYTTHWLVEITVNGQTFYVDNFMNGGFDHIDFGLNRDLVPDNSQAEQEFHDRLFQAWDGLNRMPF